MSEPDERYRALLLAAHNDAVRDCITICEGAVVVKDGQNADGSIGRITRGASPQEIADRLRKLLR